MNMKNSKEIKERNKGLYNMQFNKKEKEKGIPEQRNYRQQTDFTHGNYYDDGKKKSGGGSIRSDIS